MFNVRSISRLLGDAGLGIAGLLLGAGLFLLVTSVVGGDQATASEPIVTLEAATVPPSPATSPSDAVASLLDAEVDSDATQAFTLLSAVDRLSHATPSMWADRNVLGVVEGWSWVDEDALVTRLHLTPGLSLTNGWSPAEAIVTWRTVDEDGWRVSLVDSVIEPAAVDPAGVLDAADAWLSDPARCEGPVVGGRPASSLFAEACEAGGVRIADRPAAVTGQTAADLTLSFGEDVSSWARSVEIEGGRALVVAAVGSEWFVIDVVAAP